MTRAQGRWQRFFGSLLLPVLVFAGFTSTFSGESDPTIIDLSPDPELFGIVGLDPWYTYNADPQNYPDDVNRALLERMASDMARLGARWIRIEFHAENSNAVGPGPIDYSKHDWFINEVAPRYGLNVLAVFGSGLIGDRDPDWGFEHINEPLDGNRTNRYVDAYVDRAGEIMSRYGSRIAAVEVLNEPNANQVLSNDSLGAAKAVVPAIYGELISRTFDTVKSASPSTAVVLGGILFDDENGTSYDIRGRSYDMDWLEGVYASRAVMSYKMERGRHPFDAIAVHPYFMEPHEIIEYLHQARDLQIKFGDRAGRIWITEIGWPAQASESVNRFGIGLPSEGELAQAAFLSAVYTTVQQKAPFVDRIFWFKYEDFPTDGAYNGWGLVRLEGAHEDYGAFATPWPRKLAFSVYQALARPDFNPAAPVDRPGEVDGIRYFGETGHTLGQPFLAYWESNGGLERFGMPITEPFDQRGTTVQYFERARLESYPQHAEDGWGIQIGHLGRYLIEARGLAPERGQQSQSAELRYFPETGFRVAGAFRAFWESNQGLVQFGYPITPEFVEDGVTVQYFERARLEYVDRPDGDGYEVVIGEIGNDVLAIPGWYR